MKKHTEEKKQSEEFFAALAMLEKEKGIKTEYLLEKIRNAVVIAVKRDYGGDDNIDVVMDPAKGQFSVALRKTVVAEVTNPATELTLEEAKAIKKNVAEGDEVVISLQTKEFGRIAAQTAKHVIRQGIREAERSQIFEELHSKSGELISATVSKIDSAKGSVILEIGRSEAVLPKSEQVPGEEFHEGDTVKVFVVDVAVNDRGPRVLISRTNPGIVRSLFENEVPEIADGIVKIHAVSREAGMRTKIAVSSSDENVDPRGACIGPKGTRVSKIVDELGGEKIDVVLYSENPEEFIAEALSPAKAVKVEILDRDNRVCRVLVPEHQLSLAIGNKGQNARLAARLTGYKIDIRPESGYYGEDIEEEEIPQE